MAKLFVLTNKSFYDFHSTCIFGISAFSSNGFLK